MPSLFESTNAILIVNVFISWVQTAICTDQMNDEFYRLLWADRTPIIHLSGYGLVLLCAVGFTKRWIRNCPVCAVLRTVYSTCMLYVSHL